MNSSPATPDELERFEQERSLHERRERTLLWKDLAAMAIVAAIVVVRQLWMT